jgi:hypothetical protein
MRGIFAIRAEGNADQSAVDRWVALALKHATSLPAKNKGAKSASRAKPPTSKRKKAK